MNHKTLEYTTLSSRWVGHVTQSDPSGSPFPAIPNNECPNSWQVIMWLVKNQTDKSNQQRHFSRKLESNSSR